VKRGRKPAPTKYTSVVTHIGPVRPMTPELRQQLVKEFARWLEADYRRRHGLPKGGAR